MFIKKNEFSLYIEAKKSELGFDTYIETILWYIEQDTSFHEDFEHFDFDDVAKNLNRKILENVAVEARNKKLLKDKSELIQL